MFLTINDLQGQIQLAKKRLYVLAKNWLETQKEVINSKDKVNWLNAFQASTKEEMQQILKSTGFPLIRNVSLVNQSEEAIEQEGLDQSSSLILSENQFGQSHLKSVPKVVYVCHSSKNNEVLMRLCQLTTLMEQLHTLEELTSEVQTNVHFRGLNLAYRMARSINKEWRDVEKGRETIDYYSGRLQVAESQYQLASDFCKESLKIYREQLEARIMYFNETLSFFVECLSESFASVKDERYWITRFLLSPLPWHSMLNEVASILFAKDGFINPTADTLQVGFPRLKSITERYAGLMKMPYVALEQELQTKIEKAENEQKTARVNLQSMSGELDILIHMQSQRQLAALLFPTQPLSMLGFFQGIAAAMGQNQFYSTFVGRNLEQVSNRLEYDQSNLEPIHYSNVLG